MTDSSTAKKSLAKPPRGRAATKEISRKGAAKNTNLFAACDLSVAGARKNYFVLNHFVGKDPNPSEPILSRHRNEGGSWFKNTHEGVQWFGFILHFLGLRFANPRFKATMPPIFEKIARK